MFSRRLALAWCSGEWATVKMPMRLAAMSSAVTSARSSPVPAGIEDVLDGREQLGLGLGMGDFA